MFSVLTSSPAEGFWMPQADIFFPEIEAEITFLAREGIEAWRIVDNISSPASLVSTFPSSKFFPLKFSKICQVHLPVFWVLDMLKKIYEPIIAARSPHFPTPISWIAYQPLQMILLCIDPSNICFSQLSEVPWYQLLQRPEFYQKSGSQSFYISAALSRYSCDLVRHNDRK